MPGVRKRLDVLLVERGLAESRAQAQALVLAGPAGDQTWELQTVSAEHSPSAKHVDGERRFYAVRGQQLLYATELAPAGQPYGPHLNAALDRV